MNWQRGLFRVWLIGSICWIGYALWDGLLVCRFSIHLPSKCQYETPWSGIVVLGVGVPLLALLIGGALMWVGRGFKR